MSDRDIYSEETTVNSATLTNDMCGSVTLTMAIPHAIPDTCVEKVARVLVRQAGGFTETNGAGVWEDDKKEVIAEDVSVLMVTTSLLTAEAIVEEVCQVLRQESSEKALYYTITPCRSQIVWLRDKEADSE